MIQTLSYNLPNTITTSNDIFNYVFRNFDEKDMWKLCIDRKDHWKGKDIYEKEDNGYLKGTLNGIEFIKQNINTKFNFDFLIQLHTICVKDVIHYKKKSYSTQFGPCENDHIYDGFNTNKATELAKKEWYTEKLIYDEASCPKTFTREEAMAVCPSFYNPTNKRRISRIGWQPENKCYSDRIQYAKDKLNNSIESYYKELYQAETNDKKLEAIVRLIRYFEITHCFTDGNQRTNNIMIQKLLIENGFYPCILRDPRMFGGYYGVSELVDEVKEGIRYFCSTTNFVTTISDSLSPTKKQLARKIGEIRHLIKHRFDNINRNLKFLGR